MNYRRRHDDVSCVFQVKVLQNKKELWERNTTPVSMSVVVRENVAFKK